MTPERYAEYLAAFNARDYDTVCSFFSDDIVLYTEGHTIRGEEGIRTFYQFFHEYVREQIEVKRFVSDDNFLFAEATMNLTGLKHLSQAKLNEEGYHRFVEVPEGLQVSVNLFLHYDLEGALFKEIRCSTFIAPD